MEMFQEFKAIAIGKDKFRNLTKARKCYCCDRQDAWGAIGPATRGTVQKFTGLRSGVFERNARKLCQYANELGGLNEERNLRGTRGQPSRCLIVRRNDKTGITH